MTAPPRPLRVVQTVGSLASDFGGPSRSVTLLSDALARAGVEVEIVTVSSAGDQIRPLEPNVRVREAPSPGLSGLAGRQTPLGTEVEAAAQGPSVVHDHGVWLPANRVAALTARAAGRPLVLSPKGMLSEWALGAKRVKKAVAWRLYQRRTIEAADVFQATAHAEAEDVRRLGFQQPIAVIPHGVHVPSGDEGEGSDQQSASTRTALFLSRIHPKKGLPDLIAAWADVQPEGWRLVIAGPDEGGHRAEVERQVQAAGLGGVVSFAGPVADEEKWDAYRAADLFVLPTHSENFGIVVAEALAAGLPVLTTRGAPWEALVTHRCGWWVETGAGPIAQALRDATATPPETLRAMGARGRAYVEAHLSWDRAAAEHLALYRWLLGTGPRPDFVI